MSAKINTKLIDDFLIPALDREKYANAVQWTNSNMQTFRMLWPRITQRSKIYDKSFKIFTDWDKEKGRKIPTSTAELVKSRQRFKAALRKLKIKTISTASPYREFQIMEKNLSDEENVDFNNSLRQREIERNFQNASNRPDTFEEFVTESGSNIDISKSSPISYQCQCDLVTQRQ